MRKDLTYTWQILWIVHAAMGEPIGKIIQMCPSRETHRIWFWIAEDYGKLCVEPPYWGNKDAAEGGSIDWFRQIYPRWEARPYFKIVATEDVGVGGVGGVVGEVAERLVEAA
jgi:hypothetical protein